MKLSYKWLKEYIKLDAPAGEVARRLTMAGSEVGTMESSDGDTVMELEITTNRPDCLNMIGLAREAGAVFGKDIDVPEMKVPEDKVAKNGPSVKCVIEDRDLCPFYTARVISNVRITASRGKMKEHITSVGLRSVNNAVDVTNFCLMETGQPLHAFDMDKIKGGVIVVRRARKGEKITTIDGVERELSPGMLVIADAEKTIAVAGVMGGKDTEVTEETRNIALESAYFDPVSVRRTSRSLGLSSDSSYRFERGVDKGMVVPASDRAALLIQEETGGEIGIFLAEGTADTDERVIELDVERMSRVLGTSVPRDKAKTILTRLGARVISENGNVLSVEVPSFRGDLSAEEDLIEEVARVFGYGNIPATVPRSVADPVRKEKERLVHEKARGLMVSMGFNEIMTYSLVNEAAANAFAGIADEPVALFNPLSEENKVLTPQIVDGMLRTMAWNMNRKNRDLSLFEIGKAYSRSPKKGYTETPVLCAGMTGTKSVSWKDGSADATFYDLKGAVETLSGRLGITAAFVEHDVREFSVCALISGEKKSGPLGVIAEVDAAVLKEYDIEQPVYVAHLNLDRIAAEADLKPVYTPIARFPDSVRDVSVLCDGGLAAGVLVDEITRHGNDLIRGVRLVDVYEGEQIPEGKKSVTFSISYGACDRTLTEEEIEKAHGGVRDHLAARLKVSFR